MMIFTVHAQSSANEFLSFQVKGHSFPEAAFAAIARIDFLVRTGDWRVTSIVERVETRISTDDIP